MSRNSESTNFVRHSTAVASEGRSGAIEPWFAILLSALVPLMGALFLPAAWRTPLHLLGGILCVWGLVLLVRHEMIVRRQRNVTDL